MSYSYDELRAAIAAGQKIQANRGTEDAPRWVTLDKPEFSCPAHLYRIAPAQDDRLNGVLLSVLDSEWGRLRARAARAASEDVLMLMVNRHVIVRLCDFALDAGRELQREHARAEAAEARISAAHSVTVDGVVRWADGRVSVMTSPKLTDLTMRPLLGKRVALVALDGGSRG